MPRIEVLKTKAFEKLLRKEPIDDTALKVAVKDAMASNRGSLGHKLFKIRIGSRFGGKRGSYRVILYYRIGTRIVFLYLYAKNEKANLNSQEQKAFFMLSKEFDRLTGADVERLVSQNELVRCNYDIEE
jgi:hypothetical protein